VTTTIDCPTFVDLHALAQAAPAAAGESDPFGDGARRLPVRAGPCALLAITVPAGPGQSQGLSADTWVLVESGRVVLTGPDGDVVLEQGQSAVIARATPFSWRTDAAATATGMAYGDGPAGTPGIYPIDNHATLAPSSPPAPEVLTSDTPSCRSNNHFASADEQFKCGIWDSSPYQRKPIHFRHTELMHLLAGKVSFSDAAGRTATFAKGDTYIIEQGADCTWESCEQVAKIYAQFRPLS